MVLSKSARLLRGEPLAPGTALPEGLERAQPLDGVEQLGPQVRIGARARQAAGGIAAVPEDGGDQREERGGQHDQRDAEIEEGHRAEDEQGRQPGHEELRQVLAEVHLELLHALDQRERHVAGATAGDLGRPQRHQVVVEPAAQSRLHAGRRLVGEHGAHVLEPAAQRGDGGGGQDERHERAGPRAGGDLRQQPAEQRQARDARHHREESDQDGGGDARADTRGQRPEPTVDVHGAPPSIRPEGA